MAFGVLSVQVSGGGRMLGPGGKGGTVYLAELPLEQGVGDGGTRHRCLRAALSSVCNYATPKGK